MSRQVCPQCGGRVRAIEGVLFPRDALVRLEILAETYPLRMNRILDLIEQMPPEGVEHLLRMIEELLSR